MFIKFIIPCWNAEREIGRMLDSILGQTFTDYHIVCVDDCSTDKTVQVLQKYQAAHPDKMTVICNQQNVGAGQSRNIGYETTVDSIPSNFIWIVDADDTLADKNVLQKIYDFHKSHLTAELICLGCTLRGKYMTSNYKFPHALWGVVVKSDKYVASLTENIQTGNDIYPHFIMFDAIDDKKILTLNQNCYVWKKSGNHKAKSNLKMDSELSKAFKNHKFKKKHIERYIIKTYRWIKRQYNHSMFQYK